MKFSKFSVRDWVYIAVLGALWGALEMTLGAYLHLIFPSLANTFFVGLTMAGLGSVVALIGHTFVPKPGAALCIGIITAILKVFSMGGVVVGAIVAILAEVTLIELALLGRGEASRWRYVLAGALAVCWNFFHKFIMMRVLYGKAFNQVYLKMVQDGADTLNIDVTWAVLIIAILFVLRMVVGGAAGWLSWDLGRLVAKRLARV